jgi:signal peptidase
MWHDHPQLELVRRKLLEQGHIEIPSVGYSMYPVIRTGDLCKFRAMEGTVPTRGSIVLFADQDGRLIGHRFIRAAQQDNSIVYICKGDTNLFADAPVRIERLLGILVSIERKNHRGHRRTIPAASRYNALWGSILMKIPSISYWLRRAAILSATWNDRPAQRQ